MAGICLRCYGLFTDKGQLEAHTEASNGGSAKVQDTAWCKWPTITRLYGNIKPLKSIFSMFSHPPPVDPPFNIGCGGYRTVKMWATGGDLPNSSPSAGSDFQTAGSGSTGKTGEGESAFGDSALGEGGFVESGFGESSFGESGFGESSFGESGFGGSAFTESGFEESLFEEVSSAGAIPGASMTATESWQAEIAVNTGYRSVVDPHWSSAIWQDLTASQHLASSNTRYTIVSTGPEVAMMDERFVPRISPSFIVPRLDYTSIGDPDDNNLALEPDFSFEDLLNQDVETTSILEPENMRNQRHSTANTQTGPSRRIRNYESAPPSDESDMDIDDMATDREDVEST
jgi:hypothetical protein